MIRASVLIPIVTALDAAIADSDDLLAQHGLKRSDLRDPYASVSLMRYVAMLEAAAARVGDPAFGLRLGTMMRPNDLGPAGLLFATASSLRRGLEHFGRYLATLQSATQVGLLENGTWSAWTYRIEEPAIWPRAQDSELTLAAMCSLIRTRLGQRWAPAEVHFEHAAENRHVKLRAIFRAPIQFDQPLNQIIIEAADLDRPLRSEDADVTPALLRHAQDLLERAVEQRPGGPLSLSDRVGRIIGARIGLEKLSVAGIAQSLGMSARSLQRGLADEGTSLRELLRHHRRQFAEQRLAASQSSHALIAHALGYADATVFWRAFKHWNGTSPTTFRRQATRAETAVSSGTREDAPREGAPREGAPRGATVRRP